MSEPGSSRSAAGIEGRVRVDRRRRLLTRHPDNPLLTAADWPYFANSVFNAGAVRLASGETLLLCRVEDYSGRSHFCAARSEDGVGDWRIDPKPTLAPDPEHYPEEAWGIEDPRVVRLDEVGKYSVTYTCYSPAGPGVSLALTEDFDRFERIGNIMVPEDKDATLLPRRFGGRWALIHRPVGPLAGANIWISYSPDLKHWGDHRVLLRARRGPWWDATKIGLSPPPIETEEGWLMMYHGVRETASGCLYRIGLALLDSDDPSRCLRRSTKWIFGPERDYERMGDVWDVVFPCGHVVGEDGDTLRLYYGAADTSVALAEGSVRSLLDWLRDNSQPGDVALE
jgi:predicted GH43/DUF377 family glycosyl hydrolase